MKKTMSNAEMVQNVNRLYEFINKDAAIPVKVSYAVTKNFNRLSEEIKPYEQERVKIIQNEDLTEEEKVNKLNELLKIENEVDICMVPIETLNEVSLSAKDMMALYFMLEE